MASYDLDKLPDAKKTGEEIIRIIQQELLLQFGSKETAVVPEEHAQRLLVGVSSLILKCLSCLVTCQHLSLCYPSHTQNSHGFYFQACGQLELISCMKGVLCQMEMDCMGIIKSVLAGMAVGKFWDVLEDCFAYNEDLADRPPQPSPVPEEKESDLPASSTTTKGAVEARSGSKKRKSGSTVKVVKKPKGIVAPGIPLKDATTVFPTHRDRYHYAGNPGQYIGPRKSVRQPSGEIRGVYSCQYTQHVDTGAPPCNFINEQRNQMAQHIREYHLGIALGCWICQLNGKEYKVYGGKAWSDHMKIHHGETHSEADFFKPAHLDLSGVKLADEVPLDKFLQLLGEQQSGASVTVTESATDVEVKLEVATEGDQPPAPPAPAE